MHVLCRPIGVVLCALLVCQVPVTAKTRTRASRRVLGVIVQTDHGRLDNSTAELGANVYSCDKLETDEGGVLRVKVMTSQLFLSASSLAALEDEGSTVQALAMAGTVGFTASGSDGFSVRTPAGVVRPSGAQGGSGQITYVNPHQLLISAVHGDLVLEAGGELRTIPEGKAANVTFDTGIDNGCHEEAGAYQTQVRPIVQNGIGFKVVGGAAVAVVGYLIWRDMTESDSKTKQ